MTFRALGMPMVMAILVAACGGVQIPAQKSPPVRVVQTERETPPPPPSAVPTGRVVQVATAAPVKATGDNATFVNASAVTVGRGDTVYELSRRHRVPVPAIIRANDLEPPYLLQVGQRIELPRGRQHTVARGDTMYSVAQSYDVGLYELARLNGIDAPYTIRLGQVLVVPEPERPDAPATARSSAPQVASTPATSSAPPRQIEQAPVAPESSGAAGQIAVLPPVKPPVPVPAPPPRAGKGFVWPVKGRVLSNFGAKDGGLRNDGINISASRGTPVVAAENGVVAYAGNEIRGFGNLLLIKHDGGYITAYAHNDTLLVKRGDQVKRGQKISTIGSSGSVAEPQLHFEIRKGRRPQDPRKYLQAS